jgi:hypothetical protein
MPPVREPTRFNIALAAYGLDNCVVNDTTMWIGVDGGRDWPNARRVEPYPGARRRVDFLAAPVQADLVAAFVNSPEALVVEDLFIGTSHWYLKSYNNDAFPGYDMAIAVAALLGGHLPALRSLTLGDMEDPSGGLRMFGTIGDIGHIFAVAPALQYLGLHGNFALDAPVRHDAVGLIEALFDNSGITGDAISQEAFDNLLSSSFPRLHHLSLELTEGGDEEDLTIPDAFFAPDSFPSLARLDLDRLAPAAKARLDDFMRERRITSTK